MSFGGFTGRGSFGRAALPKSWIFGPAGKYVDMGHQDTMMPARTSPFSVSVWLSSVSEAVGMIVSSFQNGPPTRGWNIALVGGKFYVQLFTSSSTGCEAQTSILINDGQRHSLVWTHDGTAVPSGYKLYVDGVSVAVVTIRDSLGPGDTSHTGAFQVGARDTASPVEGHISHPAYWGKALSAAEVLEVHNAGVPPDLLSVSCAADLLGWWRLDENDAVGANGVVDRSAAGHHGTAQGGLAPIDTVKYWNFRLPTQCIDIGPFLPFERTQPFTLSIWAKEHIFRSDDVTHIFKMTADADTRGYMLGVNVNGALNFQLRNGVASYHYNFSANNVVNKGEINHLVVTYDGTSIAGASKLYKNAVFVPPQWAPSTLSSTTLSNAHLAIGSRNPNQAVPGRLWHASVWGIALSPAQVVALYGAGTPPDLAALAFGADLLGWWPLDGGDGVGAAAVLDRSSGAHHGTAQGGLAPSDVW